MLLLLLMVSTLQLPCPPSCPSAISPLCGPGQTSQHILSAAETGRNLSAETHLQEGKRSRLLTSPCLPNVTAADSQAEELQTFHHQNPGERSSNGLFVNTEPAEPTGTVESNSDGARVSTSPQSWSLCRKLLLWVWFWCPVRVWLCVCNGGVPDHKAGIPSPQQNNEPDTCNRLQNIILSKS